MEETKFYLICTTPNEKNNSVRVSWHSDVDGSYLEYKKALTNEFIKIHPNSTVWSTKNYQNEGNYNENDSFFIKERYVLDTIITGINPNEKYIYHITDGIYSSIDKTFIIDNKEDFSFFAFADFQNEYNLDTHILINEFIKNNPTVNLAVGCGDLVGSASVENEYRFILDNRAFDNLIFATSTGDHEYWATKEKPYKMYLRPYPYNHIFNNPKNGEVNTLNSSYYFIYNKVLFVFFDCGDSNTSKGEIFNSQIVWFNEIVKKEENNYQYLVVLMHKSLYGSSSQDTGVSLNLKPLFSKVFEENKVDLVISGHDHQYSRTYPLKNDRISENGTIYLDLGVTGNKRRFTDEVMKESLLHEKIIDVKENSLALGSIISVTRKKLIIEIRDKEYNLVDKCELFCQKN